MWNRTIKTNIRGHDIDVIIYLDVDDSGAEIIKFRSMLNEYFMTFEISCIDDRDLAHSLIENFPIKTIKDKILTLAYDNGAIE